MIFGKQTHSLPIHKPTNESSRIRAACLGCAVAEPSSIEILNRAIGVDQQSAMPYPITYLLNYLAFIRTTKSRS